MSLFDEDDFQAWCDECESQDKMKENGMTIQWHLQV